MSLFLNSSFCFIHIYPYAIATLPYLLLKPECGGLVGVLCLTKSKNEFMDKDGKWKTKFNSRLPAARGHRKGPKAGYR